MQDDTAEKQSPDVPYVGPSNQLSPSDSRPRNSRRVVISLLILLAFIIFGRAPSVVAIIGIILLIGVAKKNAILMIDFALDAERGAMNTGRRLGYLATAYAVASDS